MKILQSDWPFFYCTGLCYLFTREMTLESTFLVLYDFCRVFQFSECLLTDECFMCVGVGQLNFLLITKRIHISLSQTCLNICHTNSSTIPKQCQNYINIIYTISTFQCLPSFSFYRNNAR